MKIRTKDQLQQYLDEDIVWRKKELTTLYLSISNSRSHQENVYIRGAMTLLYAHWEGYIKNASLAYLNYINYKGKPYSRLKPNFIALGVMKAAKSSNDNYSYNSCAGITDFFVNNLNDNFSISPEKVINTESNLNSRVLKDIFYKTGLEYTSDFELNEKRIDEKLIQYRNRISHGEKTYDHIELKCIFEELKSLITHLLEQFKDKIIISVETDQYLSS